MEARRASQPAYPFQLSLRIRHPSIDPALISQELQIEPEHCFRAGDPREASRTSGVATPVHVDSYWLATLDLSTLLLATGLAPDLNPQTHTIVFSALDTTLTVVTGSVLRRHSEFFHRIQSEGGEVRLIVAISTRKTRGFTFTPQLSKALSDLRIPVDIELAHR